MHTIHPYLLRRTIKVAVVGCGGTGSAIVGGLPHLHQALIAGGHPVRLGSDRDRWGPDLGSKLCPPAILRERDWAIQIRCPYQPPEPVLGTRLAGSPAASGHWPRSA